MKVIEIDGPIAQVEEAGVRRAARVDLVDGVKVGDYVIVHAGIAIERLELEAAEETLRLFEEMFGPTTQPAGSQDEAAHDA
jgi:hydrogenase expression/formation protein HypC